MAELRRRIREARGTPGGIAVLKNRSPALVTRNEKGWGCDACGVVRREFGRHYFFGRIGLHPDTEHDMSKLMTVSEIVKENEEAMKRAGRRASRNKKTARAFLIRAGILNKRGKGLAKPYR